MPAGHVIFIGAGPGAADLITRRGWAALGRATVVLADALADPALREAAPAARWIDVGKRGFAHTTAQAQINQWLVEHAQAGACVARLKGGDPSIFGRLEEEIEALQAVGIAYEVIPGVSAAQAAAAAIARPLTRRGLGRSVAFSTAMTEQRELRAARRADTEIFYMAGQQLGPLSQQLLHAGWPGETPVCVVSRAGWPDQVVSDHTVATLPEASAAHAGRPAVVLVGTGARPVRAEVPTAIAGHHIDTGTRP